MKKILRQHHCTYRDSKKVGTSSINVCRHVGKVREEGYEWKVEKLPDFCLEVSS